MWNHLKLGCGRAINLLQHVPAPLRHHYYPSRKRDYFLRDTALICSWLSQDCVKGRDDRHSEFAQQGENVTADVTAEDAKFMLQTNDVDVADIEKLGCAQIRGEFLFFNLKANYFRIFVTSLEIVYCDRKTLAFRISTCHSRKQV